MRDFSLLTEKDLVALIDGAARNTKKAPLEYKITKRADNLIEALNRFE